MHRDDEESGGVESVIKVPHFPFRRKPESNHRTLDSESSSEKSSALVRGWMPERFSSYLEPAASGHVGLFGK